MLSASVSRSSGRQPGVLTQRIRFPGEPDEVAYLTAPATKISSTTQDAKTAALSREFAVSNAAESSSVALRSAAAPLLSAVFASSYLAGATHGRIEGAATPVPRRYGHIRRSTRLDWLRRHRARAHRLEVLCSTRTR